MDRIIAKGFSVYHNGQDPVYVAQHSGSSFEISTGRDDYSDTVGSLCWQNTGGTLIVSTIARKRVWGIDYNRDLPPMDLALRMYPEFLAENRRHAVKNFRAKYAFVAKNKADYIERRRIYESFWHKVGNSGSIIVLLHRDFSRIKNFPSLMDIVAYEGKGVDTKIIGQIISEINRKYGDAMRQLTEGYKRFVLTESMRIASRIEGSFSSSNPAEYSLWLHDDMKVLKDLAEPEIMNQLSADMSPKNYLAAVESALKKDIEPKITLENIFKGRKALSVKSRFFNQKFLIMEAEVNAFLGYWHPGLAAAIIVDIINMLRGAKLYKHLGIRQTRMGDFMNPI